MKHTTVIITALLFFIFTSAVFAQETKKTTSTQDAHNSVIQGGYENKPSYDTNHTMILDPSAALSAFNVTAKRDDGNSSIYLIDFNIVNYLGSQSNLLLSVELVDHNNDVIDQVVYHDEIFSVNSGEKLKKTLSYQFPAYVRSGTYFFRVNVKNIDGFPFSSNTSNSFSVDSEGEGVYLERCYLMIDGLEAEFSLRQGVDVSSEEVLKGYCYVNTNYEVQEKLTPVINTHHRTSFGPVLDKVHMSEVELIDNSLFEFSIPLVDKPQAYSSLLSFQNDRGVRVSNIVDFHYVVRGASATVQYVSLDKDFYNAGDVAKVSYQWSGSADSFVGARVAPESVDDNVLVFDIDSESGGVCSDVYKVNLDTKEPMYTNVAEIPIVSDCINPRVNVEMSDASGAVLVGRSYAFNTNPVEKSVGEGGDDKNKLFSLVSNIFILFVLVIIFYIFLRKIKGVSGGRTTTMTILFITLTLFGFGTSDVLAATSWSGNVPVSVDSYGGWSDLSGFNFSVSINKDVYRIGDTLSASVNVNSAVCANTAGVRVWARYINYSDSTPVSEWQPVMIGNWVLSNDDPGDPGHMIYTAPWEYYSDNFPLPAVPGRYAVEFGAQISGYTSPNVLSETKITFGGNTYIQDSTPDDNWIDIGTTGTQVFFDLAEPPEVALTLANSDGSEPYKIANAVETIYFFEEPANFNVISSSNLANGVDSCSPTGFSSYVHVDGWYGSGPVNPNISAPGRLIPSNLAAGTYGLGIRCTQSLTGDIVESGVKIVVENSWLDLKVNGQDGPVVIRDGDSVNVTSVSSLQNGVDTCETSTNPVETDWDSMGWMPNSSGTGYTLNGLVLDNSPYDINLSCTSRSSGEVVEDSVKVLVLPQNSTDKTLTVTKANNRRVGVVYDSLYFVEGGETSGRLYCTVGCNSSSATYSDGETLTLTNNGSDPRPYFFGGGCASYDSCDITMDSSKEVIVYYYDDSPPAGPGGPGVFSCTNPPTGSGVCAGDDLGLTGDLNASVVSDSGSCTAVTKCEYYCPSGTSYNAGTNSCDPIAVTYSLNVTKIGEAADAATLTSNSPGMVINCNPGCGSASLTNVPENTAGTITGSVPNGQVSFSGCTSVSGQNCNVTMNGNKNITATFSCDSGYSFVGSACVLNGGGLPPGTCQGQANNKCPGVGYGGVGDSVSDNGSDRSYQRWSCNRMTHNACSNYCNCRDVAGPPDADGKPTTIERCEICYYDCYQPLAGSSCTHRNPETGGVQIDVLGTGNDNYCYINVNESDCGGVNVYYDYVNVHPTWHVFRTSPGISIFQLTSGSDYFSPVAYSKYEPDSGLRLNESNGTARTYTYTVLDSMNHNSAWKDTITVDCKPTGPNGRDVDWYVGSNSSVKDKCQERPSLTIESFTIGDMDLISGNARVKKGESLEYNVSVKLSDKRYDATCDLYGVTNSSPEKVQYEGRNAGKSSGVVNLGDGLMSGDKKTKEFQATQDVLLRCELFGFLPPNGSEIVEVESRVEVLSEWTEI